MGVCHADEPAATEGRGCRGLASGPTVFGIFPQSGSFLIPDFVNFFYKIVDVVAFRVIG
jgi:hypothetical protein